MRKIIFRGKKIDTDDWIYGNLICHGDAAEIMNTDNYFEREIVYSKTVGQYTNLNDKNGKKIFEGDVVVVPKSSYVKSPPYLFNDTIKGVIEFGRYNQPCYEEEKTNLGYYIKWFSDNEAIRNMLRKDIMFWFSEHFNEIAVIGNIHDNPELLEVQNEK